VNTMQFGMAVLDWLQADPSHVVAAASVVAALTPTPVPGTLYAKIYKIVDLFAVNVLKAKDTGVTPAAVAEQIATLLATQAIPKVAVAAQPAPAAPAATVVNVTP
jgi:hypothetical protein